MVIQVRQNTLRKDGISAATFIISLLFVSFCSNGWAHQPTAGLNGGNNSWTQVDAGSVTSPRNIMSYSGGWYDPVFHQFCIFGGGHWDYSGNEVWCFDIANTNWQLMYAPDEVVDQFDPQGSYNNYDNSAFPGALFNPDNEPIANANPMSKHTYDQNEYVDGLGPIIWGGYSWGDSGTPWCQNCADTWAFNFDTSDWLYLYDGSNPSPNTAAGIGAAAYNTNDGLMYVQTPGETWVYDPTTNVWNTLSISGSIPGSIEATMEYDRLRNVFYYIGGNYPDNYSLFIFNPDTRVWTEQAIPGAGPSGNEAYTDGIGAAFDTHNDVLLVYHTGNIWVYDPDSQNWSKPTVPGNAPGTTDQIYGRFRYDPVNNGAWLHGWDNGQHTTWFYRYSTSGIQPAPVISMVANPPTLAGGGPITIHWGVSNAANCTASGDWSGSKATSGSETINISASSATFTLDCDGQAPATSATRTVSLSNVGIGGGGSSSGDTTDAGANSESDESGGGGGASGWWLLPSLLLLTLLRRQQRYSEK